jgi:hypothetical protein
MLLFVMLTLDDEDITNIRNVGKDPVTRRHIAEDPNPQRQSC